MNAFELKYEFSAKLWEYDGKGSWHFITLPTTLSMEIREVFKLHEEGWGRLKVVAKVGAHEWKTAIWYGTKYQAYLLPIKSDIRRKEQLEIDSMVTASLLIKFHQGK